MFTLIQYFAKNNVKYVICGGVACVLQGVERATYDIDLSVSMDDENLKKIIDICSGFNMIPRIPEPVTNLLDKSIRDSWIQEKGALVYTFVSNSSPLQLDIFLTYPITYEELVKNADVIEINTIQVIVSSIPDLISAKKSINPPRKKDLIDIEELEALINE